MPGGDRTGPAGMGPMTGRAAGYCAGYGVPGFANPIPGRGYGYGGWGRGGGGRGHRNGFYATGLTGWRRAGYGYPVAGGAPYGASAPGVPYAPGAPYAPTVTREQEVETLKNQAAYFEDALDGIKKRIEELESKAGEK